MVECQTAPVEVPVKKNCQLCLAWVQRIWRFWPLLIFRLRTAAGSLISLACNSWCCLVFVVKTWRPKYINEKHFGKLKELSQDVKLNKKNFVSLSLLLHFVTSLAISFENPSLFLTFFSKMLNFYCALPRLVLWMAFSCFKIYGKLLPV